MKTVKEFLESSTIHGLVYISTNRSFVRLFWIFVVIIGFSGAGYLIQQSFSSWATSPVATTIETLPMPDLHLPNVTVCPPRNSFTSLNPDLVMSGELELDEKQRKELAEYVSEAAFVSNYNANFLKFIAYKKERYINWYLGISKLTLPYEEEIFKKYDLETSDRTGTISTPYFKEEFDENKFELVTELLYTIYVPDNLTEGTQLVVHVEYDLEINNYAHIRDG